MSEFRRGDEVTVSGVVDHVTHEWIVVDLFAGQGAPFRLGVRSSEIVTHTPKPREFTRDDKVVWGSGNCPWEFLMRYGDLAVVGLGELHVATVPYRDLRPAGRKDK